MAFVPDRDRIKLCFFLQLHILCVSKAIFTQPIKVDSELFAGEHKYTYYLSVLESNSEYERLVLIQTICSYNLNV